MSRRFVRSLNKDYQKGQEMDTDIDVCIIIWNKKYLNNIVCYLARTKNDYTNVYDKNGQKFNWSASVLQQNIKRNTARSMKLYSLYLILLIIYMCLFFYSLFSDFPKLNVFANLILVSTIADMFCHCHH